jgi:serine/threonine protein kinase
MNDFKKFKFINDIQSKYKFGKFLGKGAFGKVLRCIHRDSGSEFAIKIMEKKMVRQRKVYV